MRRFKKKAPPAAPPLSDPVKSDQMPMAWGLLALSLGLLMLAELAHWGPATWRKTNFLNTVVPAAVPIVPTPWPSHRPLPGKPGPVHTSCAQVARLFGRKPGLAVQPLRIAYFADSMIEGDLVTEFLRKHVQERFGGTGVGWVGMAPLDAWARDDIHQTFDSRWERHSVLTPEWEGRPYGPMMASWTLQGGHGGLSFKGVPYLSEFKYLAPASLWYGPVPLGGKAQVTVKIDGMSKVLTLSGTAPLNALTLSSDLSERIDLSFDAPADLAYFGVSFDQGSGVDCFSSRGSHGGLLTRLDLAMLKALQAQRHYDLVITQFGINAIVQNKDPEFRWYRPSLGGGLRRLQEGLQPAALLLVSATDRGVPSGGAWVSDPNLPALLAVQQAVAKDLGVPFVNAFDLMGGPGTMVQWAQANPRLAERDFTHMTPQGAKLFEEQLWKLLQKGGRKPTLR